MTADNGAGGGSDGSVDTVSVIDLEANPPRVIDRVTVGDAPEGLAMSPKGDLAVVVELRGSNLAKTNPAYHAAGAVTALKIDGKQVSNVGTSMSARCLKAWRSAPTAVISMSGISSTRICGCCGSTAAS